MRSRLALLVAPILFGLAALAFGQDASWDLRNYHYYAPWAWQAGRVGEDLAVAHVATWYNPTLHWPFLQAVQHLPPWLVGFLLGTLAGMNAWLLYRIAMRLQARPPLALFLALAGLLGAGSLAELGTSFGDNLLSLPVLAAISWLMDMQQRSEVPNDGPRSRVRELGAALGAGLLLGAAAGLKLPFAVYALATGIAFVVMASQRAAPRRRYELARLLPALVLGGLAGFLTSAGWWMLDLWQRYANPLFPYFNGLFESPWASEQSYRDARFVPQGLLETLFMPFVLVAEPLQVGEVGFRDARFALLQGLLILLVLRAAWRRAAQPRVLGAERGSGPAVMFLLVFVVAAFACWSASFGIYRYLVPLEMLAPQAIWVSLRALLPRLDSRRLGAVVGIVLLGLLATTRPADWGRRPWADDYFGVEPPDVEEPARTLVLMAGYEPSAYLIAFFPPQLGFLRIQGYFTGPQSTPPNGIDRLIARRIDAHAGPLRLIYREHEASLAQQALRFHGLRLQGRACRRFMPHVEPDRRHPFLWCEVAKTPSAVALQSSPSRRRSAGSPRRMRTRARARAARPSRI